MTRRKLLLGVAVVLVVLIGAGAVFALTVAKRPGDISNNPKVAFNDEPTSTPVPDEPEPTPGSKKPDPLRNFVWAHYGYSQDRRHYLNASLALRPPFGRVWTLGGRVLLEFPPVMAEGKLFLLKNNGAVYAIDKRNGKVLWKRKVGNLAAASPAYGNGRIFVPLLERGKNLPGALYALDAKTGKVLWRRLMPSRTESSPVFDNDRVYFGSESGRVYSVRAGDGAVRWTYDAKGAVKCALALADGKLYFGDYSGHVYALRQADGSVAWNTGAKSGAFGFRSGQFYSTPAVAYGRVYIGNTDGKVYAFEEGDGQIAWTYTMPYWAYGSPGVWNGRVYATSYDGTFAALSARTGQLLWRHKLPYKTTASPTIIGRLVYVGDLGAGPGDHGHLTAFDAVSGRRRWFFNDGKYSTVIAADGRLIVAGVSHVYALLPRTAP
jgi:YD repeat-containing protein